MTTKEALHHLNNAVNEEPDVATELLYFQPDSNTVYFFYCRFDGDDLFIAEGYRWKNGSSYKSDSGARVQYYYAATRPKARADYNKAKSTLLFRKNIYTIANSDRKQGSPVVIWYNGEKSVAEMFSHGNSKFKSPFLTTLKTTREDIKTNLYMHPSAKLTYTGLSNSKLQNGWL